MKYSSFVIALGIVLHTAIIPGLECTPATAALEGVGGLTLISEIQGNGHVTPYERTKVEQVPGIITAILPTQGFFMQNPIPDDDVGTSEGIFIKYRKTQTIAVGDLVLVAGRVEEYYPGGESSGGLSYTRIKLPKFEILGSGFDVPQPTVLGIDGRMPPVQIICNDSDGDVEISPFDPEEDGIDFFESLESMLVQINRPVSVGTIHTAYGEFQVVGDDGSHAGLRTPRGGLVLREGDFNPERIVVDVIEDVSIARHPENIRVVVGDTFTGPIVGIISYAFGIYKVLPVEPLPEIRPAMLPRQTLEFGPQDTELTVGTFNIENYSAHSGEEKTVDLAETIAVAMGAPDIVVLSEVQDDSGSADDGTVSAAATAQQLIGAIEEMGGPEYIYIDVPPEDGKDGGQPGGNIRVGIIYNPDRVGFETIMAAETLLPSNPARIDPGISAFNSSRKPLVARFFFQGRRVYVIGVHFSSKGGDGELFGRSQPPVFSTEDQRARQAKAVADFISRINAEDGKAGIIVAGDFNDFHFSRVLRIVSGGYLVNTAAELLEPEARYTYVFEGNSQTLDHILVSPNLYNESTKAQILHRYAEYLYGERQSDHDPVVVALRFD